MIAFAHEGEMLHTACPLHLSEVCPIPEYERKKRRNEIAEMAGFPKRYATQASWDKCRAKKPLQEWLAEREAGDGLLLHGPVGTGKTCASFLVTEALWDTQPGLFVPWVQMAEGLSVGRAHERRERLLRWGKRPLLVIDDFGVGEIAPWAMGYVDQLFEMRNGDMLPTIVTTNLTPKTLREVEEWRRFVDRWSESMVAVSMPGESMRRRR